MVCSKLLSKQSTGFSGSMKCRNWWWMICTKLFGFLRNWNLNTPEFAFFQLWKHKLCVSSKTNVDVIALVACFMFVCLVALGMYESFMPSLTKLDWIYCRCSKKENIFNLALSPLCLVYMNFFIPLGIKLGCRHCIGWKQ